MRFIAVTAVALMLIPVPVHATDHGPVIAELYPNPVAGDREFIEIWNPTDAAINITGWTISDAAGNNFTFPAWTLAAHARVVVWGGGAGNSQGPAWTRSTVWNNGGDVARLTDAAGRVLDSLGYGDGEAHAAPDAGESLQWADGWRSGDPSPGTDYAATTGDAGFTVENVAPTIHVDAPTQVRAGDVFAIGLHIDDANGDIVAWQLIGPDVDRTGSGSGWFNQSLTAPASGGVATWRITASDGNASTNLDMEVMVRAGALQVLVPAGGIRFPTLQPGATEVVASAPFVVRNAGSTDLSPRIDISPFRGPANVTVDDNLRLRIDSQIVHYAGPLTPLPDLAAGAQYNVTLVLVQAPVPLPAGDYGTTFAVVA